MSIPTSIKTYLSVIALLCINSVKPLNKNYGYSFRSFSKKLAFLLEGQELSLNEEEYLLECMKYWRDWQKTNNDFDIDLI